MARPGRPPPVRLGLRLGQRLVPRLGPRLRPRLGLHFGLVLLLLLPSALAREPPKESSSREARGHPSLRGSRESRGNIAQVGPTGYGARLYPLRAAALRGQSDDTLLLASAGNGAEKKNKDDDDEDKKTLSQQVAEGKYGLIQKELFATPPRRPGVISYKTNPEVPRDTAANLGGLDEEEIWLAEDHLLVLRGGAFRDKLGPSQTWPPIDEYQAPPRQVKLPANPRVPPPFPVQLTDNGPTQFLTSANGTRPFGHGFLPLVPYNASFLVPPFPFPPPGNFSSYPPQFPFLPPGAGVAGGVPGGALPYPIPPPDANGTPLYPVQLPFPPPNASFFQSLPPGAAFLPPPANQSEPLDEDDPSIYYPPPYDFYYPKDNSSVVPPGPLVPGIILPPPPDFFAPLEPSTTTRRPPTRTRRPPSKFRPSIPFPAHPENEVDPTPSALPPADPNEGYDYRRPKQGSFQTVKLQHHLKVDSPLYYQPAAPAADDVTITTTERTVLIGGKRPKEQSTPKPHLVVVRKRIRPARPPTPATSQEPVQHITQPPADQHFYNNLVSPTPEAQPTFEYDFTSQRQPPAQSQHVLNYQQEHSVTQSPLHSYQQAVTPLYPEPDYPPVTQQVHNFAQEYEQLETVTQTPIRVYEPSQTPVTVETYPAAENSIVTQEPAYQQQEYPVTQPPVRQYQPAVTRVPAYQQSDRPVTQAPLRQYHHQTDQAVTQAPLRQYHHQTDQAVTQAPLRQYHHQTDQAVTQGPLRVYNHQTDQPVTQIPVRSYPQRDQYVTQAPQTASQHITERPVTQAPIRTYHRTTERPQTQAPIRTYHKEEPVVYQHEEPVTQIPIRIYQQEDHPIHQYHEEPVTPAPVRTVTSAPVRQYQQAEIPDTFHHDAGYQHQDTVTQVPLRTYHQTKSPRVKYYPSSTPTPQPPRYYQTPPDDKATFYFYEEPVVPGYQSGKSIGATVSTSKPHLVYETTTVLPPRPSAIPSIPAQNGYYYLPANKTLEYYGYDTASPTPPSHEDVYYQPAYYQPTTPSPPPRYVYVPEYQYQSTPQPSYYPAKSALQFFNGEAKPSSQSPKPPVYEFSFQAQSVQEPPKLPPPPAPSSYKAPRLQGGFKPSSRLPEYGPSTPAPTSTVYTTSNPLYYYTQQDDSVFDDITKKYFSMFGRKLPQSDGRGDSERVRVTTPLPPLQHPQLQQIQASTPRPFQPEPETQGGFVPIPGYSLAGDTLVNYRQPLPPINPDAELISPSAQPPPPAGPKPGGNSFISYQLPGNGGHFYFLTPQQHGAYRRRAPRNNRERDRRKRQR